MALKFKLDNLDGLDDATKALYVKSGDKFILAVEGAESGDVAGLKTQVEALLGEKKALAKKVGDIEAQRQADAETARLANEEAARKSGDTKALEASWQAKRDADVAATEAKYKPLVERLTGNLQRVYVDSVAEKIANEIAVPGTAALLVPHIKARLRAEERDGEFVTTVVDTAGKPSAFKLEDLTTEFKSNPAFAPVIAGSKASGGGAGGGATSKGSGGSGQKQQVTRTEFAALNPQEQMKVATSPQHQIVD